LSPAAPAGSAGPPTPDAGFTPALKSGHRRVVRRLRPVGLRLPLSGDDAVPLPEWRELRIA